MFSGSIAAVCCMLCCLLVAAAAATTVLAQQMTYKRCTDKNCQNCQPSISAAPGQCMVINASAYLAVSAVCNSTTLKPTYSFFNSPGHPSNQLCGTKALYVNPTYSGACWGWGYGTNNQHDYFSFFCSPPPPPPTLAPTPAPTPPPCPAPKPDRCNRGENPNVPGPCFNRNQQSCCGGFLSTCSPVLCNISRGEKCCTQGSMCQGTTQPVCCGKNESCCVSGMGVSCTPPGYYCCTMWPQPTEAWSCPVNQICGPYGGCLPRNTTTTTTTTTTTKAATTTLPTTQAPPPPSPAPTPLPPTSTTAQDRDATCRADLARARDFSSDAVDMLMKLNTLCVNSIVRPACSAAIAGFQSAIFKAIALVDLVMLQTNDCHVMLMPNVEACTRAMIDFEFDHKQVSIFFKQLQQTCVGHRNATQCNATFKSLQSNTEDVLNKIKWMQKVCAAPAP